MMLGILLACAILSAAAFFAAFRRASAHADTAFQRIKLRKIATAGEPLHTAVSHDGRYIAYVEREGARQSLWIRQVVATSSVQVLAPADVVYKGVTFSSDDGFLYYVARQEGETVGSLYQIPALGGLPKHMMSGVDTPIALTPDGQFLAFVRDDPARGEMSLITVRPDGSNERRLLTRKQPETLTRYAPAWSPDGKVIACPAGRIAGVESKLGILAVNVVDGSAHLLGERKWTFIGQIAWLGDGSGVVFHAWNWDSAVYGDPLWLLSYPEGDARLITNSLTTYEGISVSSDSGSLVSRRIEQVSRIWIAPVTGAGPDFSRAKQLPFDFNENFSSEFGLDWAPGGRLIYASEAGGNLDIWTVDPNDSRQKQLTGDASTDTLPAVSAGGRHIVFVSDRSGYGNIWRMDIDGGNPKQLTRGKGDFYPALSPDGKWVVFSSWDGGEPALWRVSIDGGEPVRLVRGAYSSPVISPDGKWISYFNRIEKENKGRIALLPFAGGEPKFLETVSVPDFGLIRWLPDGRALTYIVTRDGVSNLRSLPIDGGAEKQLTRFTADRIFRFAWSPDGKNLAYERGSVIKAIVLINGVPSVTQILSANPIINAIND
jgi:Tol biopolymer transport system component